MVLYSLEPGECLAPLPCSPWASSKEACTQPSPSEPRTTQLSFCVAPLPVDLEDGAPAPLGILCPWIMFYHSPSERKGVAGGAALKTLDI